MPPSWMIKIEERANRVILYYRGYELYPKQNWNIYGIIKLLKQIDKLLEEEV